MNGWDAQLGSPVKRFSSFNFMKNVQIGSSSQGSSGDFRPKDEDRETPAAPVPHLLNSNAPPSEEERKRIEEALVIARRRMATIQDRIRSIDDPNRKDKGPGLGRVQIEKSISLIQAFIHTHESLTSCTRTLPVELLQLIFTSCLPHLDPHRWNRRSWKYGPSFPISQVCKRWRQVAHDTPQLWSVLGDIKLDPKTAKKGPNSTFHFINEFLHRSRGEGLWLYISGPFMEYATPGAHPLIDLLLQYSDRWAVVTIVSTWKTITSVFYNRALSPPALGPDDSHHFPRLRRLGIELWKPNSEGQGVFNFKHAPILEDLYIFGTPPTYMAIPLEQLRKYRECSPGSAMTPLGDVLHRSKGIERLEIIGLERIFYDNPGGTRLDHLKVLHLKMGGGSNGWVTNNWRSVEHLISNLTLPSLEELKIAGCPGAEVVSILISLIRRSHCILQSLSLNTSDTFPRDLDRLLELTPQLEELDVDIPSMMDMFVLALGNGSSRSDSTIVPNLKRLALRPSPSYSIERCTSLLLLIARARFNHGRSDESHTSEPQNKPSRTTSFRLVFPDQEEARAAQICLYICAKIQNVSPATEREDEECLKALKLWRARLREELPELDGMTAPAKRIFDLGFSHRLNKLMGEIEKFEHSGCLGLSSLLTSKMHHSMHQLSQIRSGHIPGDNTYNFRDRSNAILMKWESYLKDDMGHLDWALMGHKSLVYIPEDNALRDTRAVFDMIYGMKDDLHAVDLDWMGHM